MRKYIFLFTFLIVLMIGGCATKKAEKDKMALEAEAVQTTEAVEDEEQESAQEQELVQKQEPEPSTTPTPFISQWKGDSGSKVYMTRDISPQGLMAVYRALGVEVQGEKVAVKLSTGEPGSNYLDPQLIKDLVREVNGTIVECNTAYGATSRKQTEMHLQVAKEHGYTAIADVDIMDAEGSVSIPVKGGTRLTENFVGANFLKYDYFVVLSHFKGHEMAGFGGAIKNISIGIASSEGKSWIHTSGRSKKVIAGITSEFQESMAEAGKSVVDSLEGNILYINVMNKLSVDCDCNRHPAEPRIADIGILASTDPVALDQACVDFIYGCGEEGASSLITRMEKLNGVHTLEHAQEIGLGSRQYQMVNIDD